MEDFLYEIGDPVQILDSELDWIIVNKKRNPLDKDQKLYNLRCKMFDYEKNIFDIPENKIGGKR